MNLRAFRLVACGMLLAVAARAAAEESLHDLWTRYQRAADAAARKAAVEEIARDGSDGAARHLASAASDDPSLDVRIAAIEGLGRSPSKEALDLVLGVLRQGGVHPVRRAAAAAVARQAGGVERLVEETTSPRSSTSHRDLAIAALGEVPGLTARGALCRLAVSADPSARVAAMHALASRREGREVLAPLLPDVLAQWRDLETILSALDLAEEFGTTDVRPAATALGAHADPAVRDAAESVLLRLDWLDAAARRRPRKPEDPYARGEADDPLPPPPRGRADVVYAFDATGSIAGYERWLAARVAGEGEVLRRSGASVRVGVVAFRDRLRGVRSVRTQVLPLTYDASRVSEFLDGIRAEGVDARGTDAGLALGESMDRMPWRRSARRNVVLIVDSKIGDPERAQRIASLHAADRTRLDILYLLRTRGGIPESVTDLARSLGTTVRVVDDVPDLPGR